MTTPISSAQQRDRGLGRGVGSLVPQTGATSPADQAAAALAALQTVPVHIGVLQAAIVLLEEFERSSDDTTLRAATGRTV